MQPKKITNPNLTPEGARRIKRNVLIGSAVFITMFGVFVGYLVNRSSVAFEAYLKTHQCTVVASGQFHCPNLGTEPVGREDIYRAMDPYAYRNMGRKPRPE